MTTLTLVSKPACHLCDVARGVIETVLADIPDAAADAVVVDEVSILDDAALHARWWEKIPVVLVDGELVGHWRIAPDRLRAALLAAAGSG